MYNLLVMQLVASAIIVGYMFVKVSYVILNKYFHPPYQRVLRKARLAAGRRRWSAPADRVRDWYLDWKYQHLEGSNAGVIHYREGANVGIESDTAHTGGRDARNIVSVNSNTLNQTRTEGQAWIFKSLQILWQRMYNMKKYCEAQNFIQCLYKIYLLCASSYIKAYNIYITTKHMNKLPKSKRKSLVLILEAISLEDGDAISQSCWGTSLAISHSWVT